MNNSNQTNSDVEIDPLLEEMAQALEKICDHDWLIIGIHTGGVWVAKKLHQLLGLAEEAGELDVSFYRDDYQEKGMHKGVKPSRLPASLDGRNLILVDDVLHTGRTIRAALDELFDYGRPAKVVLAVLVDRSGRELPITADVIGITLDPGAGNSIRLNGPDHFAARTDDVTDFIRIDLDGGNDRRIAGYFLAGRI